MTQIGFETAASLLLDESTVCHDRPLVISDEGGLFMEMKQRRRNSKDGNYDKYFSSGSRKVSHTPFPTCFMPAAVGMFLPSHDTPRRYTMQRSKGWPEENPKVRMQSNLGGPAKYYMYCNHC